MNFSNLHTSTSLKLDFGSFEIATLRSRTEEYSLLWESSGRGAKPKWTNQDLEYIETCLNQEERTYNSVQLARKLKQERAVDKRWRSQQKNLKKKRDRWKRTRQSNRRKQNQHLKEIKQADLAMLKMSAEEGYIDLKYFVTVGNVGQNKDYYCFFSLLIVQN